MSDINYISNSAYEKYSFDVIPVMGQIIAGDWKSYKYLVESIRQFPNQVCPIKFVEHFTCITKYNFQFIIPSYTALCGNSCISSVSLH